jgi:hypothetical protein
MEQSRSSTREPVTLLAVAGILAVLSGWLGWVHLTYQDTVAGSRTIRAGSGGVGVACGIFLLALAVALDVDRDEEPRRRWVVGTVVVGAVLAGFVLFDLVLGGWQAGFQLALKMAHAHGWSVGEVRAELARQGAHASVGWGLLVGAVAAALVVRAARELRHDSPFLTRAADREMLRCPACGHEPAATPKRTILGFRRFTCERCSESVMGPLSRRRHRVYVAIVFVAGVVAAVRYAVWGEVPIPGLLPAVVAVALYLDAMFLERSRSRQPAAAG